jgi:hypothetical protein
MDAKKTFEVLAAQHLPQYNVSLEDLKRLQGAAAYYVTACEREGQSRKTKCLAEPHGKQRPACTERFPLVGSSTHTSGVEHDARPHEPDDARQTPRTGNGIHTPSRGIYGISTAIRRSRVTCERPVSSVPKATVVTTRASFMAGETGGRVHACGVPQHRQWHTAATSGPLKMPTTISSARVQRLQAHKNTSSAPLVHGPRARPRSSPPSAHRMLPSQQRPISAEIQGIYAQVQLSELSASMNAVNTCASSHRQAQRRCAAGSAPITASAVHSHQQKLVSGHILHPQQIGTQSCGGRSSQQLRQRRGPALKGRGPPESSKGQLPRQRCEEMQSHETGRHYNCAGGGGVAELPPVAAVQGCKPRTFQLPHMTCHPLHPGIPGLRLYDFRQHTFLSKLMICMQLRNLMH